MAHSPGADMVSEHTTFGDAAQRIGALHHHLDRLAKKNAFPYTWAGKVRLIRLADLPLVRKALEEAGYAPRQPELVSA